MKYLFVIFISILLFILPSCKRCYVCFEERIVISNTRKSTTTITEYCKKTKRQIKKIEDQGTKVSTYSDGKRIYTDSLITKCGVSK